MELENNNKFIDIFSSLLFNSKNRSEFLVIFLSSVLDDLSLKTKLIESFELIKINFISIWCRLLVSELDSETKDYLSTRIFVLLKETNQVNLTENHQDSSSIFSNFTKNLLANFLNCDFGKRSALNLRKFLINLAISDILLGVFCVPFTYTDFMLGRWIFPSWLCPAAQFIQILSVFVTAYTLTIIGIERQVDYIQ